MQSIFDVKIERLATRYGRMYVVSADTVISRSLRLYGEWAEREIAFICRLLRNGPAIIDIGANVGTHSLAFAARFPESPVIAAEPQPLAFNLLATNAIQNRYSNIKPLNLACGPKSGLSEISQDYEHFDWNVGGVSLLSRWPLISYPVAILPLDLLVQNQEVQFIKIDVEGMESDVIAGAQETILRCQPIIYFEVLEPRYVREVVERVPFTNYRFFWLVTSQFNENNFNSARENIWTKKELGVLAFPAHIEAPAGLASITDDITEAELAEQTQSS